MEPVLGYRIMEYETIENQSKNWTENPSGKLNWRSHWRSHWNQGENQIESNWKSNGKSNYKQTENFISKLILPDHIIILNQNSDFWHKISFNTYNVIPSWM